MINDIRDTVLYQEADELYRTFRRADGAGIWDAAEMSVSADGRTAVFTGSLSDEHLTLSTRICQIDVASHRISVLTDGPNIDRSPKYSPDCSLIAFLSDRIRSGDFQLYLIDANSRELRAAPSVDGWIEYLHWSPDGRRVLLGVAGRGVDVSSASGGVKTSTIESERPSWMPDVKPEGEDCHWRHVWVYDLASDSARRIGLPKINVWEATWCGDSKIVAVVSETPGEGAWYSSHLELFDVESTPGIKLQAFEDQVGCLSASPSGEYIAVVNALCSDRGVIAGDLHLGGATCARFRKCKTGSVDISYVEWLSDRQILLAGHRGAESVTGLYDVLMDQFIETWSSERISSSGRYISVSGLGHDGDFLMVAEGFLQAPEIALVSNGRYRTVKSFHGSHGNHADLIANVDGLSWKAFDGLEIQGWLLRPQGAAPYALVMHLHGGPVWHRRPGWLGRSGISILLLLKHGYAVFFPNPRGSSGRGQAFARLVVGDMGGMDASDCTSGLDNLIGRGIADPACLGVTGVSYGGFLSAWLITKTSRFAAAVPVAPTTNHITHYLLSNIPNFVTIFLGESHSGFPRRYFERSPIMHAHQIETPVLNICGALDRCAPVEESLQFHQALSLLKKKSTLVMYPEEGHGIRGFPAVVDYAARIVGWFNEHVPISR